MTWRPSPGRTGAGALARGVKREGRPAGRAPGLGGGARGGGGGAGARGEEVGAARGARLELEVAHVVGGARGPDGLVAEDARGVERGVADLPAGGGPAR